MPTANLTLYKQHKTTVQILMICPVQNAWTSDVTGDKKSKMFFKF